MRRGRLLSGLRMRWELARRLGPRRGRRALRLLAAEVQIRAGKGLSRRGVLGLAGGGALGLALGTGGSATASADGTSLVAPSRSTVARLLRTGAVRSTIRVHGHVDAEEVTEVRGDGERVLVLRHEDSSVITFVDARAKGEPTVVSMDVLTSGAERSLRFYDANGTHLADVATKGGRVEAVPAAPSASASPAAVPWLFIYCFTTCIADEVDTSCIGQCFSCGGGSFLGCTYCALCAGPKGIKCARRCR